MNDYDELITRGLNQSRSDAAFRLRLEQRSSQALSQHYRRRLWIQRAAIRSVMLIFIISAFLVGRYRERSTQLPEDGPGYYNNQERESVRVQKDLVTWLEAGRFFAQLGMPQRADVAYQEAILLANESQLQSSSSELAHQKTTIASLVVRHDLRLRDQRKQQETRQKELLRLQKLDLILAQTIGG